MTKEQLAQELRAFEAEFVGSHPAINHPLFDCIREGSISMEAIRIFVAHHQVMINPYNQFVANLIANSSLVNKTYLVENLFCELGYGKYPQTHPQLFQKMAQNLGVTEAMDSPEARCYVEVVDAITRHSKYQLAGLAMAGISTENLTLPVFSKIVEGLTTHYGIDLADLDYYTLHMGVDEEHTQDMYNVILDLFAQSSNLEDELAYMKYMTIFALDMRLKIWEKAIAKMPEADRKCIEAYETLSI